MASPSGIRYNPSSGRLTFSRGGDSTALTPLAGSRSMNRGPRTGSADKNTAQIQLSNSSIQESASIGSTIGALTVNGASGAWSFSKLSDPDNKFIISGTSLNTNALLDYETKTAHNVTIQATNGSEVISRVFSVSVINVVEGTLTPTTASFNVSDTAGTVIATVGGLDAGASETITSITPNDGRLAIASGNQIVKGLSPSSAGSINATVTTSAGRTLNIVVTVASNSSVALDPIVTTAMSTNTQDAFGFDRIIQGYSSPTARFQRGDTQQSDFGFDPLTGAFDKAGLLAWAGQSASLVKFYSQKGTGKELVANTATSLVVISGGLYKTFATDWSNTDGQLTTNQSGGLGVSITGGGYLTLSNSGYVNANGMEFHLLAAPFSRKKATAQADATELGATATSETLFSYGTATSNYFRYIFGGGTSAGLMRRIGTTNGGTDQNLTTQGTFYWKKNAQTVLSFRNDGTEISMYGMGRRIQTATPSAGNITANASLDNGQLRIGESYATGTAGNMLFGGIVITNTLAAVDRTYIHFTMNAVAQQHRVMSATNVYSLLDEVIDFRDVDGNGLVAGRKGKTSIQFNKTTGTPAWDFAYVTPHQGLQGVRSTSASNVNNTYRATNNYMTDVQTGTMLTFCVNENTDINQTFSLRNDGNTSDFSLGMGRHHSVFNMQRRVAVTHDAQEWTGHLYTTESGDNGGGKISQAMAKYQFNLSSGDWTPGQTTTGEIISVLSGVTLPIGTVLDTAAAATVGWFPPLPEHIYSTQVDLKDSALAGELLLHIATFKKGTNYNPTDPVETRRLYMRTGTNWSYTSHPGVPVGHMDGCIARELGTGSIVHGDPTHRIQSNTYQGVVNMGTHIMWAFAKTELTMAQVEQLNVNLYKFIYQGYPT